MESRPKSPLDLLPEMGRSCKGVMESYGHAIKKMKKFLEIWLPIVHFLHHVVKDTRVLLVLCEGSQLCIHED